MECTSSARAGTDMGGEPTTDKDGRPIKYEGWGKTWSFRTKLFALIWIAVWCSVKWALDLPGVEVREIIWSGVAIAALFSPVDISKIADKINVFKRGA